MVLGDGIAGRERAVEEHREGETEADVLQACSRNWKKTADWLVGGRGEEEEAGNWRGPMAQGLVGLDKNIALFPRTSGKPWQSFKKGRDMVRSVSPS